MQLPFIRSLAERYRLPVGDVELLAVQIAERCALIANRYEPEGEIAAVDLGLVESVGAAIGAAILQEFPPPPPQEVREKRPNGGAIGGPGFVWKASD